jgi:glycosyltransferase involved in cell wall biosynthesis
VKPLVTVIIASYNQREYLVQAIESVLGQTYDKIEIIIVDNGSTDGSQELIKQYEHHSHVRVILHDKNIHITTKLNQCVDLARGDFVAILHGDDYYLPHKIERQMAIFQSSGADTGIVYGPGYRRFVDSGKQVVAGGIRKSGNILPWLLRYTPSDGFVDLITALFRRDCLIRYRFYDDLFVEGEAIFFRMALGYSFHYCDEPLVVMLDHAGNLGKSYKANFRITTAALDRLGCHPEFPAELLDELRRLKGRLLRDYGWQCIRVDADTVAGRQGLLQAIGKDWRQSFHPRVMVGLAVGTLPPKAVHGLNLVMTRALRAARRAA